jgi:tetratricopeptide (TPR) repeat protein
MARGRVAAELFRDAAERLGVVVAASNNSRNGPIAPVVAAIEAVWRDTHARLALDDGRVYAAGMSGGTEAALIVGRNRGAGVIACAGPVEPERLPVLDTRLAWIGLAGEADFCFDPTRRVVEALVARGLTARFATFDGRHGWPPAELAGRALELLELVAMRNGLRARDEALVDAWHEEGLARLGELVTRGRHDEAAEECAALARELNGLRPASTVDALRAEARRLAGTAEAKKDRKRVGARSNAERNESARLATLRHRLEKGEVPSVGLPGAFDTGGGRDEGFAPRPALESALSRLVRRAAVDDPEERVVAWRVLDAFFIDTFALALARRSSGQLETAETLFDLCGKVRPESASAAYEKSRTLAARGDSRKALAELRRAVGLGFRDAARLREEPEWAALRDLPDFRSALVELDAAEGVPR